MRKFLFVIASIFISSCTNKVLQETPLQYSFMPSYLNIDSIQSFDLDDTNRVVDSTLDDFQSIAIDGGNLISSDNDTINLPPGILISDRKAMLYPFYKASWERLLQHRTASGHLRIEQGCRRERRKREDPLHRKGYWASQPSVPERG